LRKHSQNTGPAAAAFNIAGDCACMARSRAGSGYYRVRCLSLLALARRRAGIFAHARHDLIAGLALALLSSRRVI